MKAMKGRIILICIYSITLLTMLSTLWSCTKEKIGEYRLYKCYLDNSSSTNSKSNQIPEIGFAANLFISNKENINNQLIEPTTVTTIASSGEMTSSAPIYLPLGEYQFTAFSTNGEAINGLDISGESAISLQNGKDYLLAVVNSNFEETNIHLNFKHLSSLLDIVVETIDGASISLNEMKITLPDCNESLLDRTNQRITSTHTLLPLSSVAGSGNTRSLMILPCTSAIMIELNVSGIVNGDSFSSKIFRCSIQPPFIGGCKYSIKLTINPLIGIAAGISIDEWTTFDNTITIE